MTRLRSLISRLLPKSRFARGVAVLASGTAAGQAIVVLASPILTRLYSPDDFGVLAVYGSFLGIFTVVAGLCYQLAIPLPRSDGAAANILALSLISVGIVTAIVVLIVILLGDNIVVWTNTPVLRPYFWLLPLGVALGGAYQAFNYWAVRKRAFTRIAGTKLQQGVGKVGTQVGLGFVHLGPLGLILGQVVGQVAGLTGLVRSAWHGDRAALSSIRYNRIRWAARRYRRFPIYSTWSSLANTSGSQLPPILFAALFSPAIAGLYMLANRILQMPMQLLGGAIGQVFHSSTAVAKHGNGLDRTTITTFDALARVGTGPLLVFAVAAPEVFSIVFGTEWYEAGVYVQLLIPMLIVQFVFSPLSTLAFVMELQRGVLVFQLSLLFARLAAIVSGAWLGSVPLTIAFFSGASSVVYIGALVWLFTAVGIRFRTWFGKLAKEFYATIPFVVIIALAKKLLPIQPQDPIQAGNLGLVLIITAALALSVGWRVMPLIRDSRNR